MKIAEIVPVFFPVPPESYGGIELVASILTDGLVARGHEVVLFASGDSETKARLDSCIPTHCGLADRESVSDELYHETYAYLRTRDVDVIHDHGWFGPSLAAVRASGPPVVHTLHGAWNARAHRDHVLIGDRIHRVAVSMAQADENRDVTYADVIHHGLHLEAFPLVRNKEDYLVYVGRATVTKAPEIAVDVAKAAGKRLVMVIKRDEPYERDYWMREVEPRLVGTETIIDAPAPEVRIDLVSRAQGLLFPIQWSEPFGLVMIEAMACGTPVLAAKRGSTPEVVVDNVTGFLCAGVHEMIAAIRRLPTLSPDACRRHVAMNFSADKMIDGYERLFERVLGRSSGQVGHSGK